MLRELQVSTDKQFNKIRKKYKSKMRSSKQEHKKELKNIVAEPKNSIDGFDSRLDQAEERISET